MYIHTYIHTYICPHISVLICIISHHNTPHHHFIIGRDCLNQSKAKLGSAVDAMNDNIGGYTHTYMLVNMLTHTHIYNHTYSCI